MRRRWPAYLAIGALFGVADFYYLGLLYSIPWQRVFGSSPAGERLMHWVVFGLLNVGIWLVPVIPMALYEARFSRSRWRSAVAGIALWCAAVVAYYLANAAQLGLVGVAGRPELHIRNHGSAHFWANWMSVMQFDILGGILEWIGVAVAGGAVVGFLAGAIYLGLSRPQAKSA